MADFIYRNLIFTPEEFAILTKILEEHDMNLQEYFQYLVRKQNKAYPVRKFRKRKVSRK